MVKKCVACKETITDEEAKRVRDRYPRLTDNQSEEFGEYLRFHSKLVEDEKDRDFYHFDEDDVEVLCNKCWGKKINDLQI